MEKLNGRDSIACWCRHWLGRQMRGATCCFAQDQKRNESVHVVVSKTGGPDSLCIHYDPTIVSTAEVRDAALKSGATLEAKYGHLLKNVPAMHARRASAIEARLKRVAGVLEGIVSPEGSIRVEFDREQTSASTIEQSLDGWIGDQASIDPVHVHKHVTATRSTSMLLVVSSVNAPN